MSTMVLRVIPFKIVLEVRENAQASTRVIIFLYN